jgi:hypothetical protein
LAKNSFKPHWDHAYWGCNKASQSDLAIRSAHPDAKPSHRICITARADKSRATSTYEYSTKHTNRYTDTDRSSNGHTKSIANTIAYYN